jgi:hypothetical protein
MAKILVAWLNMKLYSIKTYTKFNKEPYNFELVNWHGCHNNIDAFICFVGIHYWALGS